MRKLLVSVVILILLASCSSSFSRSEVVAGENSITLKAEKFSETKECSIDLEKESAVRMTLGTKDGRLKVKVVSSDGSVPLEGTYDKEWNKYGSVAFTVPEGKTTLSFEGKDYTGDAAFSW
ncbi:MAG: hypothetical protein ACI4S4_05820 [Candidatus Ornithospirochaeta sp.]